MPEPLEFGDEPPIPAFGDPAAMRELIEAAETRIAAPSARLTEEREQEIRERAEKATPGPWEPGDIWGWAGVMPERFGESRCAYCAGSDPEWVGLRDINGTVRLAHRHRFTSPYGIAHHISGPEGIVAGNYDYEEGGILEPADTEFIAHARADVPALLAELVAVRDERDAQRRTLRDALDLLRQAEEFIDREGHRGVNNCRACAIIARIRAFPACSVSAGVGS